MAANIKQDLLRMAEAITTNVHYPCNLGNLNILFQYEFYFDICQIIFPQLNIQLVKIRQNQKLDAGQKMDKLISLLSQVIEFDFSLIKGAQIIKGQHISHMHRFLQILENLSSVHQSSSKEDSCSRRVKSDPNTSQRIDENRKVSHSAREKIKQQVIDSQMDQEDGKAQVSRKKNKKKRAPSYSTVKKQKRSRAQTSKNVYSSLINIMMNEKNRTIKASLRDNRKVKNQQIIDSKNKYKSYLINYAKQNKAAKNRQMLAKPQQQRQKPQLPLEDFENIQKFFKSFQFKLRDQKYCYLKRIQKLVRTQQVDRMCYLQKLKQEQNTEVKKSTKKQIDRIENQHRIRNNLLKQQFQSQKQANKLIKKQYQKFIRTQKKELKENKKKQLQKIQDFMVQQNHKVLGSLQQGGRLQKVILDMYKRF